ncbi:MAG: B12-binding domain-containing radical SAM protein [Candidatus Brocadiales bacterium]|nr:B12-binding domain-containing radical SAM protein [Candidatus Brocadiales bacterium]
MRSNFDGNRGMFFPPLGLLLIAQSLKNAGYEVLLYDGNFDIDYKRKLFSCLSKNQNDILFLGFYLTLFQVKDMVDIARSVRAITNEIKIIVGGPFPAVLSKVTMESDLVDIAVIGDGAKVVVDIADSELNKDSLKYVANICFKENNKVITNQRTLRDELNEYNWINYHNFIDIEGYVNKFRLYLLEQDKTIKRAVPILTGLGCSYKCSFCENALLNHKHFSLPAENIIEQIKFYHENYNIDSFAFFDEDFLFDKKRIIRLMELIEKSSLKIKWGSQSRVNYFNDGYVNAEFLSLMEKSGCVRLAMGVESGSPAMLKMLRKGIKPEQVIRASECGKDSSIVFSYSLIVNLPEETYDDISMTVELMDRALSIKKNSFVSAVHQYLAYPETPLSIEMEKRLGSNLIKDISFEQFAEFDMNTYNKKINPLKTDYRKECLMRHGLYSKEPLQFRINIRWIFSILLRFVGRIRKSMNFYHVPVEMYLRKLMRFN